MEEVQKKPVILCVIHHCQNPSESTDYICIYSYLSYAVFVVKYWADSLVKNILMLKPITERAPQSNLTSRWYIG
jgi:hypothetical protein